jgi:hypothetical protein
MLLTNRIAIKRISTLTLALWTQILLCPGALAQQAEETSEAAAAAKDGAASDVVMLNNGGLIRGTIEELVPDDYVVIVTRSGDSKRYPMSDVHYAGPADDAPSISGTAAKESEPGDDNAEEADTRKEGKVRPLVTLHSEASKVTFKTDPPNYKVYLRSGSAAARGIVVQGYDELCTAPCTATIPAGTHTFAVSEAKGAPREADPVKIPPGTSQLDIEYVSHAASQWLGLGVMVVGASVGTYMLVAGFLDEEEVCSGEDAFGNPECTEEPSTNWTMVGLGLGITVGGLVAGAVIWQDDEINTRVSGRSGARVAGIGTAPRLAPRRRGWAPGLRVRGKF